MTPKFVRFTGGPDEEKALPQYQAALPTALPFASYEPAGASTPDVSLQRGILFGAFHRGQYRGITALKVMQQSPAILYRYLLSF